MKRYQQHTHASWHRAYAGKFQCPWCNEHPARAESTTPQKLQRKLFAKESDASRTHTATPLGHRRGQSSSSAPRNNGTPLEPQSPDSARNSVNVGEFSPGQESDANYAEYNGRTTRHNGMNGVFADKPRPPLPAEWTRENEAQEPDAMAWSGSTAQTPSGLDSPGEFGVSRDKQVDSELSVGELEHS